MLKTPGAVTGIDGTGICRIRGPRRQWSRQDGLPFPTSTKGAQTLGCA
jgi:hypothetical protein